MKINRTALATGTLVAMLIACASPLRKAQNLVRNGDPDSARKLLLEAIRHDSTNVKTLLALATLDDSTGNTREAAWAYRRVLRLSPGHSVARERLARAYLRLAEDLLRNGSRPPARDTIRLALKVDSTCAPCWERLGDSYVAIDYAAIALEHFTRASLHERTDALTAKIDSVRTRIARSAELTREGFALYRKKRWRTAENRFERALKLNAENDSARYGLHMAKGRQLYKRGRIKDLWQAIPEFGHAAEIRPDAAEPHYWLARTYQKKDRNEFVNAIDEFEKAAQLDPNSPLGKESAEQARRLRARKKLLDEFWRR